MTVSTQSAPQAGQTRKDSTNDESPKGFTAVNSKASPSNPPSTTYSKPFVFRDYTSPLESRNAWPTDSVLAKSPRENETHAANISRSFSKRKRSNDTSSKDTSSISESVPPKKKLDTTDAHMLRDWRKDDSMVERDSEERPDARQSTERSSASPEDVRHEPADDLSSPRPIHKMEIVEISPDIEQPDSPSPDDDHLLPDDSIDNTNNAERDRSRGAARQPRKRQFANRVKTGCLTCRTRKKKCDEGKPTCYNCTKGGFTCQGYGDKRDASQTGAGASQIRPPLRIESKPDTTFRAPSSSSRASASSLPPNIWPERPPLSLSGRFQPPIRERESHSRSWESPYHSGSERPSYPPSASAFSRVPGVTELLESEHERYATASRFGSHIAAAPSSAHSGFGVDSPTLSLNGPLTIERGILPPTQMELTRMSEKEKMLIGKPYRHWWDQELTEDRRICRIAQDRYNEACKPSQDISTAERGQKFHNIIIRPVPAGHPQGRVGSRVLVEAPFYCEYGYNIHLGDDVIIGPGCTFQDPCRITIGDRCVIGPNVKFYGMTMPLDPVARKNPARLVIGGSITIEDDCFIGGDVTIMGHRTIKRGSTVGASTVVTRDVPSMTIVAGSPMRTIRGIGSGQDADKHCETIQRENNASAAKLLIEGGWRGSNRR